ncbi:MAG: hypothetical protein L0154_19320 [Chloroflexi bacterium]|nr:hypothetical protein [Chloroflexota bacterium]
MSGELITYDHGYIRLDREDADVVSISINDRDKNLYGQILLTNEQAKELLEKLEKIIQKGD